MEMKVMLTIGKLAREAEVSVETIRYYQKRGLLIQPSKPEMGGFRTYSERDVGRVRFIKRAQQLGFTLSEISELVIHTDNKNCQAAKMLTEKKLKTIEIQLEALEKIRATLKSLVVDCHSECTQSCPVLRKFHGGPLQHD